MSLMKNSCKAINFTDPLNIKTSQLNKWIDTYINRNTKHLTTWVLRYPEGKYTNSIITTYSGSWSKICWKYSLPLEQKCTKGIEKVSSTYTYDAFLGGFTFNPNCVLKTKIKFNRLLQSL